MDYSSPTEAVVAAIAAAKAFVDCSAASCTDLKIPAALGLLRHLAETLDAIPTLLKRPERFRGLYPTPPPPLVDINGASLHERGRSFADAVFVRALCPTGPSALCGLRTSMLPTLEQLRDNWPSISDRLRKYRHVDADAVTAGVDDEAARADRAEAKPPTDKREQGEGNGGAGSAPGQQAATPEEKRETILGKQPRRVQKAYAAFEHAAKRLERKLEDLPDREAYDWLKRNGIDSEKDDSGELADYKLPAYPTFTRYCTAARGPLDERKHNSRAGRKTGRSIVRERETEHRRRDDE